MSTLAYNLIQATNPFRDESESTSEYSFIEPPFPPPPTNTPAPSPKVQVTPLRFMQLENIPEFAGTQEDSIQPSDFLKMVKRSFLTSGTTTDEQHCETRRGGKVHLYSTRNWCKFQLFWMQFPIICGGINANKNIDLGWNFQFYTEIIPAVLAK